MDTSLDRTRLDNGNPSSREKKGQDADSDKRPVIVKTVL